MTRSAILLFLVGAFGACETRTSGGPTSGGTSAAASSSGASSTSGSTSSNGAASTTGSASASAGSTQGTSTGGGTTGTSGSSSGGSSGRVPDGGGFLVTAQFDGDVGPGLAGCSGSPPKCRQIPEANVSANGAQVAQVTWQSFNVYDYSGKPLSSLPLATLITSAGLNPTATPGFPYEPHVLYDELIGRWLLTTTCLYDCFLVSATSDATGAWSGIYLNNNGNDPGMHLGYDINGAYLSEFGTGTDGNTATYSYSFFSIPAAELRWTTTLAPTHLNISKNTPLDGMPIIDHNAAKAPGDPAYFVVKSCASGSCQNGSNFSFDWIVTTVSWSGTTATYSADQLVHTAVGSTQNQWLFNTELNGVQAGSTVPIRVAESHRVMDLIQVGNHLDLVLPSGPCAANCGAQGVDANNLLFWAVLDCSTPSACVVAQTAKISSASESYVFGSVGVDASGNVGIAAAAMGATIDPSIRVWSHLATGPANSIVGPVTVIDGTNPYTCINNPVGFATAVGISTSLDPLDGTKLWTTMQYGESGTACVWNTRIFQYQLW